jgi:flagellar motor switch protein FliM
MVTGSQVLRRLARTAVPPPPLTPARALRLATVRAAERSIGLKLAVLSVAEEEGALDDLLSQLEDGLLLVTLEGENGPIGLVALDAEARGAAIEIQTLAHLLDGPPELRPVTAADAAMARPLLSAFVREAQAATEGTALDGWIASGCLGSRLPGAREATLALPDGRYRVMRLALDLGAGGRQGLLLILAHLPPPPSQPDDGAEPTMAAQVLAAQVPLQAILQRLQIPLSVAETLEVGQVLPLPGVTVASVRLMAGGRDLGSARLGQVAGMRAVRIEGPLAPHLTELPPLGTTEPPSGAVGGIGSPWAADDEWLGSEEH